MTSAYVMVTIPDMMQGDNLRDYVHVRSTSRAAHRLAWQ